MTSYRGLASFTPAPPPGGDTTQYIFGLSFKVTQPGVSLDGWWWYCDIANGQDNHAEDFALWQATGAGSGTYIANSKVTSGTFVQGWNFIPCSTSIPLTSGVEYRAVKTVNKSLASATTYCHTANFFDTGSGNAGAVNGPLTIFAYNGASTNPEPAGDGQMVFVTSAIDVTANYPSSQFNESWYGMDVQVSTVDAVNSSVVQPVRLVSPSLQYPIRLTPQRLTNKPNVYVQGLPANISAVAPAGIIPYAAYAFNEGGGTVIKDYSGNGRNMTTAGTNTWVPGLYYTNAFQAGITGSDGAFFNTASNEPLLSGDVTVMVWFKHTTGATTLSHAGGLYGGAGTARLAVWSYRSLSGTASSPEFTIRDSAGTITSAGQNGSAADGNWHHAACVYHANGLIESYRDGILIQSITPTANPIGATINQVTVGSSFSGAFAQAVVQDMRIFGSALTATQITTFMNTPVTSVPPVTQTTAQVPNVNYPLRYYAQTLRQQNFASIPGVLLSGLTSSVHAASNFGTVKESLSASPPNVSVSPSAISLKVVIPAHLSAVTSASSFGQLRTSISLSPVSVNVISVVGSEQILVPPVSEVIVTSPVGSVSITGQAAPITKWRVHLEKPRKSHLIGRSY